MNILRSNILFLIVVLHKTSFQFSANETKISSHSLKKSSSDSEVEFYSSDYVPGLKHYIHHMKHHVKQIKPEKTHHKMHHKKSRKSNKNTYKIPDTVSKKAVKSPPIKSKENAPNKTVVHAAEARSAKKNYSKSLTKKQKGQIINHIFTQTNPILQGFAPDMVQSTLKKSPINNTLLPSNLQSIFNMMAGQNSFKQLFQNLLNPANLKNQKDVLSSLQKQIISSPSNSLPLRLPTFMNPTLNTFSANNFPAPKIAIKPTSRPKLDHLPLLESLARMNNDPNPMNSQSSGSIQNNVSPSSQDALNPLNIGLPILMSSLLQNPNLPDEISKLKQIFSALQDVGNLNENNNIQDSRSSQNQQNPLLPFLKMLGV